MGVSATKLDADSIKCSKSKFQEYMAECERFVVDGLTQSKFKMAEKIFKEFLNTTSLSDFENSVKKARNQTNESRHCPPESIKITFGESSTGYEVECVLKEEPRISGGIRTSVSNNEASILACSHLPNLLKNEDILRGDMLFNSDKTISGRINYKWPVHVHDSKPNINLALFYQDKKPNDLGFCISESGLSVGVDFQLHRDINQRLKYEGALRHQTNHGHLSMVSLANCGYSFKSSLEHAAVFDDRDSTLFPTEGNQVKFTTELSGLGGNVNFLKNNLQMQHIFPLPHSLILETTFGCGMLKPFTYNSIYMDTFKLGGPLSVRGFQANGIDPKNNCATSYWLGNIHLYLPFITRPECYNDSMSNYHTQLFINSGSLGCGSNYLQKDFVDLMRGVRVSYGIGLVVCIKAIGKIELNYCIPLCRQKDDRAVTGFQFGISINLL